MPSFGNTHVCVYEQMLGVSWKGEYRNRQLLLTVHSRATSFAKTKNNVCQEADFGAAILLGKHWPVMTA